MQYYVTLNIMQRWSRESVIDVYRGVDQARLAEGNLWPISTRDIDELSAGSPDMPSRPTIEEYVGGISDLHHALGRVTTKYAKQWTPEQWQENAHWARDVLAEKGIVMVGQRAIDALSLAKLVPNAQLIREVWDDIGNYRLQNGIEPYPINQAAKKWEHTEFVDNGKNYAAYLGRDFGLPLMPLQDDINAGSAANMTPTLYQIEKRFDGLEGYQAALGFVNGYAARHWTDTQWRQNYEWLKDVFTEHSLPATSLNSMLGIAGRLHIGPTIDLAVERFGNLTGYGKFVGHESNQQKRAMSDEAVLRAAMELSAKKDGPIEPGDIANHPIIGINMIKRRFGGVHALNLRLGYVTGAIGWDKNKLLWWGVTRFMQQEGRIPSSRDISTWSSSRQGPSLVKICSEFGLSFNTYKSELKKAQAWIDNQVFTLLGIGLPRQLSKLAMRNSPDVFQPDQPVDQERFKVFVDLKQAGVNLTTLMHLMNVGVSFGSPEAQLTGLAEALEAAGMLRPYILRRLEPFIIGLAPPSIEDSWETFITSFHEERAA